MGNVVTVDRAKLGRASKARGKTYERDIAKALGGTRYPADTGGKLDVLAEPFGVQVKSGGNVVTEVIRRGMAEAVVGCQGTALTPLLAVVDNRGARNQTYIILRLADWLDLHGACPPTIHTLPGALEALGEAIAEHREAIEIGLRGQLQEYLTREALREAGLLDQIVDTSAKVDV